MMSQKTPIREENNQSRSQFETDMTNVVEEEIQRRLPREMQKISRELRARIFNPHELVETGELLGVLDRQIEDTDIVTKMITRLFVELIRKDRVRVEDVRRHPEITDELAGTWNIWELGSSISREGELNIGFGPKTFKEDHNVVHQLWIRTRK